VAERGDPVSHTTILLLVSSPRVAEITTATTKKTTHAVFCKRDVTIQTGKRAIIAGAPH
jgi:hypothetical protein